MSETNLDPIEKGLKLKHMFSATNAGSAFGTIQQTKRFMSVSDTTTAESAISPSNRAVHTEFSSVMVKATSAGSTVRP